LFWFLCGTISPAQITQPRKRPRPVYDSSTRVAQNGEKTRFGPTTKAFCEPKRPERPQTRVKTANHTPAVEWHHFLQRMCSALQRSGFFWIQRAREATFTRKINKCQLRIKKFAKPQRVIFVNVNKNKIRQIITS